MQRVAPAARVEKVSPTDGSKLAADARSTRTSPPPDPLPRHTRAAHLASEARGACAPRAQASRAGLARYSSAGGGPWAAGAARHVTHARRTGNRAWEIQSGGGRDE